MSGVQLFDFFYSQLAVLCLATDVPLGICLDARPQQMADEFAVIDDQN